MNFLYFKEITSTNDYLKENYQNLENYTICYTSYQTKGRGRMNRSWLSEENENIALSILIKDLKEIEDPAQITLVCAVALHQFLIKYLDNILIKWPNDLLIESKKISGILVEGISSNKIDALICGIGVNINQTIFDESINNLTTSLKKETNKDYDIIELSKEFGIELVNCLELYFNNNLDIYNYLSNYLFGKNKIISFERNSQIEYGKIIDVDNTGRLIIEVNNKKEIIESGEIKIIR